MEEKILEWGNLWEMNISDYHERDKFAWFSIDTDLSIRMIETLEIHILDAKFDSVEWADNKKLVIWLKKNVKGE